jgi:UDP-N-acetylmuramate--alanine ligase
MPDLVIYTAAHKGEDNPQVLEAKKLGIPVLSQGEAVGLFQKTMTGISVAGVGGKTTTTALLATIFDRAGKNPSYMIGVGDVPSLDFTGSYNSNGDIFITEADEYACSPTNLKPKFYYQKPRVIIIPNLAFDHPDIYKSEEETMSVFAEFANSIGEDGILIVNYDCQKVRELIKRVRELCSYLW